MGIYHLVIYFILKYSYLDLVKISTNVTDLWGIVSKLYLIQEIILWHILIDHIKSNCNFLKKNPSILLIFFKIHNTTNKVVFYANMLVNWCRIMSPNRIIDLSYSLKIRRRSLIWFWFASLPARNCFPAAKLIQLSGETRKVGSSQRSHS